MLNSQQKNIQVEIEQIKKRDKFIARQAKEKRKKSNKKNTSKKRTKPGFFSNQKNTKYRAE